MKRKLIALFGLALAAILIAVPFLSDIGKFKILSDEEIAALPKLSEEEIKELRSVDPIKDYSNGTELIHLAPREAFENRITDDQPLIYATVTGDKLRREKRAGPVTVSDYSIEVEVIIDVRGYIESGTKINITCAGAFIDAAARVNVGREIVVPIVLSDDHDNEWCFAPEDVYFVTDDGFLLSNFEEIGKVRTGSHVQTILREFSFEE